MGYFIGRRGFFTISLPHNQKTTIMNKRFILLAKLYSNDKFFTKVSHNERDMVSRSEMICRKNMGDVVTHLVENETGHRYLLDIRDDENPDLGENIKLCSKKSAIFAKNALEEYDDTLKINITKLY